MAYSTEAELRANISLATTDNISQAVVLDRLDEADTEIKTDLSLIVDFDSIVATPTFINKLAQFKTCELCLIYMFGSKRKADDITDVDYWVNKYNKLLAQVVNGEIALEDGSDPAVGISKGQQSFTNSARDDIEPALGSGKWGDFKNLTELERDRPVR